MIEKICLIVIIFSPIIILIASGVILYVAILKGRMANKMKAEREPKTP